MSTKEDQTLTMRIFTQLGKSCTCNTPTAAESCAHDPTCHHRLFFEAIEEIHKLKKRYYHSAKEWQNAMNAQANPLREKALAMALQGAFEAEENWILNRAETFYQFLAKGPTQ